MRARWASRVAGFPSASPSALVTCTAKSWPPPERAEMRAPRRRRVSPSVPPVRRHDDALARLPLRGDSLLDAVRLQRDIHLVGEPEQGELAQGGQVSEAKVVAERGVHPGSRVDETLGEALAQCLRGEVDEFDLVGATEHVVGDGLALRHAGDLPDHVAERLDVLDVDGGEHVEAGGEQGVDILPALLVRGTGCVGVRELVDEHDLGPAGQDAGEVQLVESDPAVEHGSAREHLEPVEQGERRGAAVSLDDADHDIPAGIAQAVSLLEHGEGLAHAGGGTEHDPQPSRGIDNPYPAVAGLDRALVTEF